MATLILRSQTAQSQLQGQNAEWNEHDYAVVHDIVIGRIYKIVGGPQNQHWQWNLNNHAFGKMPVREDVVTAGVEPSLEEAKAALKKQYEKWLGPALHTSAEVIKAYDEQRESLVAALRSIRETVEMVAPPGSLPSLEHTGVSPAEEAEAINKAIRRLAGPA